jgi:hypothetical protein
VVVCGFERTNNPSANPSINQAIDPTPRAHSASLGAACDACRVCVFVCACVCVSVCACNCAMAGVWLQETHTHARKSARRGSQRPSAMISNDPPTPSLPRHIDTPRWYIIYPPDFFLCFAADGRRAVGGLLVCELLELEKQRKANSIGPPPPPPLFLGGGGVSNHTGRQGGKRAGFIG